MGAQKDHMPGPQIPLQRNRLILSGIVVWVVAAAAVFLKYKDEWVHSMGEKVGFLNLPPVDTFLHPALGLAAFAHVILGVVLLASARWWLRGDAPVTFRLSLPDAHERAGKLWWIALAILLLAALAERAPRMTLSFWGDESLCINGYVAGRLKPVANDDRQGAVRFIKTPWASTVFADDGGGNNHFLYSILSRSLLEFWRDQTNQPKGAFSEPLLRVWPLVFGLASLAALAGLMRRLGLAWTGILAATLLALHPWHLRFSAEARGYTLMLFFFIMALWAWVNALERGRWRDWAAVAAWQFFALYSWKGVMYPLIAVNALAPLVIAFSRREGSRQTALGRWLACNIAAAAAFIPLVAAAQIQMFQMLPRISKMGNLPADWAWIRNLLSDTVMGCQAWLLDVSNPDEICLDRWAAAHPFLVPASLVVLGVCVLSGLAFLARRVPVLAGLLIMIPIGGVMAALHFKGHLNIELLRWYWFFLTPVIALLASVGASAWFRGSIARGFSSAVLLGSVVILSWPMCRLHTTRATEDLRGALEIARGPGYRPWMDLESSKVKTVWLWRHSRVYDPRGTTKGESVEQLHSYMREADAAGLDFYLISGYPALTQLLFPAVVPVMEDPALFEKVRTFWAQLPQNTLSVYHYRAGSLAAASKVKPVQ